MLARVKRAMMPIGASASVTVGSTQSLGESQPPVGNSGRTNEKRMIRNTARTKFGTPPPRWPAIPRRSPSRGSGSTAARMPRVSPPTTARTRAMMPRNSETGKVSAQDLGHRPGLVHERVAEVALDRLADEDARTAARAACRARSRPPGPSGPPEIGGWRPRLSDPGGCRGWRASPERSRAPWPAVWGPARARGRRCIGTTRPLRWPRHRGARRVPYYLASGGGSQGLRGC